MKFQFSFLLFSIFLAGNNNVGQAQISAVEILNKSISYHDPNRQLENDHWEFLITETRPNGSDRQSEIILSPEYEYYKIQREVDGNKILMIKNKARTEFALNGNSNVSSEQIEKFRLTEDRLTVMKDYYRYLWHLPMTLHDPGTIIHHKVASKEFDGQDAYEIKVTYDPEVGEDIWYFYFDTQDYHLIGYRFYHDEAANDGEYITLSGETQYKNLRLPSLRKWYMHQEDKFLGSDELTVFRKIKL